MTSSFRGLAGFLAGLVVLAAGVSAQGGGFEVMRELIPGGSGGVVGTADMDGDGDLDLVVNGLPGVLLNDGHGSFTAHPNPVDLQLGNNEPMLPPALIADFIADGRPDVLIVDQTGAFVIWVNSGGGALFAFTPNLPPVNGDWALRTVAAGDVDGDGDPDFAIGQLLAPFTGIRPLQLFRNDGAGVFTEVTATQMPAANFDPWQIAFADLDADGDQDLVVSQGHVNYASFSLLPHKLVLANNGAGTFTVIPGGLGTATPGCQFGLGDADLDGRTDLVFGRNNQGASPSLEFVRNLGGLAFAPAQSSTVGTGWIPVLADLDGNGPEEILVSDGGVLSVRAVTASGTLGPVTQTITGTSYVPSSGDFDGDADEDVIYGDGQPRLYANSGTGSVVPVPGYVDMLPYSIDGAAGDLDGDGDLDFVAGITYHTAINDGAGFLQSNSASSICGTLCAQVGSTPMVELLDADADGDLDLYLASPMLPGFGIPMPDRLLLNTGGSGAWTPGWSAATALGTTVRAGGDIDGDGDRDLVLGRGNAFPLAPGPQPTQIVRNLGNGTLAPAPLPATTTVADLALADADGDLDLDIIEASPAGCVFWLNDGTGSFVAATGFPSVAASSVAAGDVDTDGDLDVLLDAGLWRNNGGFFVLSTSLVSAFPIFRARFLDADLDGDLDVVSRDRLFRNLGATFGPEELLPWPLMISVLRGDFDRDGDTDLLGFGPTMLTNTTRQLVRGAPARLGHPASLLLRGPPAGSWLLVASAGTGALEVPPFGTILLDASSLLPVLSGSFDAAGRSAITSNIPQVPALAGLTLHWQAIAGDPAGTLRLTGRETTTVGVW